MTLAGTLTCGGAPLVGKTLTFMCNGWAGTGVTGGAGKAQSVVSTTRLGAGIHKVFVRFAGDADYLPAGAQGEVEIAPDLTHTIVRGKGTFLRNGNRGHRCKVEFRFNADLTAGWLKFFDVRGRKRISVAVVKSITLSPDSGSGPQAVIVCGPGDQYTVTVDADADSFSIVEGPLAAPVYEAGTTSLRGDIVIEEAQPE